jgi:uridine kinase
MFIRLQSSAITQQRLRNNRKASAASGSGKTTFTERQSRVSTLQDVARSSVMDMYNDRKCERTTIDDPGLVDYDLLLDNIRTHEVGANLPGTERLRQSTRQCNDSAESRIIIVEGSTALNRPRRC